MHTPVVKFSSRKARTLAARQMRYGLPHGREAYLLRERKRERKRRRAFKNSRYFRRHFNPRPSCLHFGNNELDISKRDYRKKTGSKLSNFECSLKNRGIILKNYATRIPMNIYPYFPSWIHNSIPSRISRDPLSFFFLILSQLKKIQ